MKSHVCAINKRRLAYILLTVSLASFLIGTASARGARGGEFVVEPSQEITENIELTILDEVLGNISVSNGFIDFCITSPSGAILLCYNKVAFSTFSFVAGENGNFTMHLANAYQKRDVEVTLNYAIHFKITLQAGIHLGSSVRTASVISPPPTTMPLDWIRILLTILTSIPGLASLAKAILNLLRWLHWKRKYGKPRTPVVVFVHANS